MRFCASKSVKRRLEVFEKGHLQDHERLVFRAEQQTAGQAGHQVLEGPPQGPHIKPLSQLPLGPADEDSFLGQLTKNTRLNPSLYKPGTHVGSNNNPF